MSLSGHGRHSMSSRRIFTIQGSSSINSHTPDTLITLPARLVHRLTRRKGSRLSQAKYKMTFVEGFADASCNRLGVLGA